MFIIIIMYCKLCTSCLTTTHTRTHARTHTHTHTHIYICTLIYMHTHINMNTVISVPPWFIPVWITSATQWWTVQWSPTQRTGIKINNNNVL